MSNLKMLTKSQLLEASQILGVKFQNISNTSKTDIIKVLKTEAKTQGANLEELIESIETADVKPSLATSRPRTGVGATATEYLTNHPDWSDQQVLEKVHERHPKNETSKACIAWYRAKLRREGVIPGSVKSSLEAN